MRSSSSFSFVNFSNSSCCFSCSPPPCSAPPGAPYSLRSSSSDSQHVRTRSPGAHRRSRCSCQSAARLPHRGCSHFSRGTTQPVNLCLFLEAVERYVTVSSYARLKVVGKACWSGNTSNTFSASLRWGKPAKLKLPVVFLM